MTTNEQNITNYKMYIFVNSDLKMGKGKIASQVAHAIKNITKNIFINYYERKLDPKNIEFYANNFNNYVNWENSGEAIIVLKATTKELVNIITKYNKEVIYTCDAGKTQVETGSLTTVCFIPMPEHMIKYNVKNHKLL